MYEDVFPQIGNMIAYQSNEYCDLYDGEAKIVDLQESITLSTSFFDLSP